MAQWDKLLSKIKSLDKDMRFAELKKRMVKEIVESEEKNKED